MRIVFFALTIFGLSLEASSYIEGKLGYYNFYNKTLRDVYKDGGLNYQISGAYELNKTFNLYSSIEYVYRHGYSLNAHQKTEFRQLAYSLAPEVNFLKHFWFSARLSVGPKLFHVHIKNHSNYVPKSCIKNIFGGFIELALDKTFSNHLLISIFGNTSLGSLKAQGHTTSINSYTVGGGVGYKF